MKNSIITILFFSSIILVAQKKQNLDYYTASNGVTYNIGDEIELNRGSDTDGRFVYVTIGGWAISADPEKNRLGAGNAGNIVTIKKIKKYDMKRYKGVYFTIGGGNLTNYNMDIENAIASCEVTPCPSSTSNIVQIDDKYDKLAKIKELHDEGVLNKEEYEAEKKKILESEN